MLQVNLEDVKRVYEQRQLWNKTPLKDIEFVWKGHTININNIKAKDEENAIYTIDEWFYTGLNNTDYLFMLLEQIDDSFNKKY